MADAPGPFGDLLIQKAGFLRGVDGHVKRLKDEMQRVQSRLNDAVKGKANHDNIHNWISQIRDRAENAVEAFVSGVGDNQRSRKRMGEFSPLQHHALAFQLDRSIRSRLFSKLMGSSKRLQAVKSHYGFPPQEDEDTVGLEEDVEMLLQKAILEESKGLSIACIVGMGGIGKTTLAEKLYNHAAVADSFNCRGWVSVSSVFRVKEVIKELIRQLLDFTLLTHEKLKIVLDRLEQLDELSLQDLLYQSLQGRRYFIVLDDLWENADWASLAAAFPDEDKASRLLITSRNRNVAMHAQYVYEKKALDPSKSWQLFLKTVFFDNTNKKCPKHLEIIGREILKKCDGLPLAIKEAGMQLSTKGQSKSEWEKVLKTLDLRVVSAALELSYLKLPPELKLCFLYFGFFKEGAVIRAEKLVQVWIAGGMSLRIGRRNVAMEEMARSYLDRLIDRNMVQVKDMTKENRVKTCRINNILHKISISKSKVVTEALRKNSSRPFQGLRHCAINCSRKRFVYSMNQGTHLHNLFFHGGGNVTDSPFYWKSFKLLRVLDFEDFGLKKLPDTIGALTRLRYLGLRNNHLQELPRSLGRLINLEVLDIALNFLVEVLPDVISKWESLCHLYMSDIISKTTLKIDALKNLQTLMYISVDSLTYELAPLQTMTSLRKLGIQELDGSSNISRLFQWLATLQNLVCLNLKGFHFRSMPPMDKLGGLHCVTRLKLDGLLNKLPSANSFPPNLSYLTLVNASLNEDPMPVLEKLPKLSYLKLQNAYAGDEMAICHGGFPKLEVLCIGELWHLRDVKLGRDAMAKLKRLEISSCPYVESLPEEVGLRTDLQELKMVTTPAVACKLRNSHIICAIPCVEICC